MSWFKKSAGNQPRLVLNHADCASLTEQNKVMRKRCIRWGRRSNAAWEGYPQTRKLLSIGVSVQLTRVHASPLHSFRQSAEKGYEVAQWTVCEAIAADKTADKRHTDALIERLIAAKIPLENLAMCCANNVPLFFRLWSTRPLNARALPSALFCQRNKWASEKDFVFLRFLGRFVVSLTREALPCLERHVQHGFSATELANVTVFNGAKIAAACVPRFLLDEGWESFDVPHKKRDKLSLGMNWIWIDSAVSEYTAAHAWLSDNFSDVTGLMRQVAEVVFAYLPWFAVFSKRTFAKS